MQDNASEEGRVKPYRQTLEAAREYSEKMRVELSTAKNAGATRKEMRDAIGWDEGWPFGDDEL